MIVKVTCLKNKHTVLYTNCSEIEQGEFWDDDAERFCIGHRLYLSDGETATFRNGFLIEMYMSEWEYNNGIRRLKIVV